MRKRCAAMVVLATIILASGHQFSLAQKLLSSLSPRVTYYVSPSGSDSNNGTSESAPWLSIDKINRWAFHPGNSILLQGNQTFHGSIALTASGDCGRPIKISTYGTGVAKISSGAASGFSAKNQQGFSLENLDFVGSGTNSNTAVGVAIDNDQPGDTKLSCVDLSNLTISDYGSDCVLVNGSKGASGFDRLKISGVIAHDCTGSVAAEASCIHVAAMRDYGSGITNPAHTNVMISHSQAYNCNGLAGGSNWTGSGIMVGQSANVTIEYNVAHDNGANSDNKSGPCGIWASDAAEVTIQYNEAYRNRTSRFDGCGFDIDGGVINSVAQYNYAHDNEGAGFEMTSYDDHLVKRWENNTFRFNISQNNGAQGFIFNVGSQVTHCYVYNNTVIEASGEATPSLLIGGTGAADCIFANNIFYAVQSPGGNTLDVRTPSAIVFAGNDWFGNGKFVWGKTTYPTFAEWQATTGQEKIGGVNVGSTVEPRLFVYGGGGMVGGYAPGSLNAYQLQTGSPMLGAGVDLKSQYRIDPGPRDYYGAAVPADPATYNIGAGGVGTYSASCEEASSFLARVAVPDTAQREQYNALICGLVADGLYSGLDALYKFAAGHSEAARANLISTKFTASPHAAIAFTPNRGFSGDGATGYLDSGFIPAAETEHYKLNDAAAGVYVLSDRTTPKVAADIGSSDTASEGELAMLPLADFGWGSVAFGAINGASADATAILNTNARGLWITIRTGANAANIYRNGIPFARGNSAAAGVPDQSVLIGAMNGVVNGRPGARYFSADQIGYAFLGKGLNARQAFLLSERINADAAALGINRF